MFSTRLALTANMNNVFLAHNLLLAFSSDCMLLCWFGLFPINTFAVNLTNADHIWRIQITNLAIPQVASNRVEYQGLRCYSFQLLLKRLVYIRSFIEIPNHMLSSVATEPHSLSIQK